MNLAISLVVPILNEAASLPQLLSGITKQTLPPKEVIFVDAGSTDGSAEIIRLWGSGWATGGCTVLTVPNGLPGGGRNAGIAAAKSEWIAFIDGGITPEPDWLEQLASAANARNVELIFGYCRFEAENPFERAICALTYGYRAEHPVLPASLFHRNVLQTVGPFRDDLRAAEDILWKRRLTQIFGESPTCQKARVHYRHFPKDLPTAFKKWRLNELNAVRARVRTSQHVLYALGLPVIWLAPFVTELLGVLLLLAYIAARGIFDPIRRSRNLFWWSGEPRAFFLAIGIALAIDIAKWIGIAQGLIEPLHADGSSSENSRPGFQNADAAVISGFGDEWTRMSQSALPAEEQAHIFNDYFDIFPWASLPSKSIGADIGCGSGRWARLASEKCGALHVVDASVDALAVARANLSTQTNVTFHHASVGKLPFDDASLDFAYSLGVLHHVPDHLAAIKEIARTLKPGAPFLVYLYYAFDNRPRWFRAIWEASNVVRLFVSRMPHFLRFFICQCLAAAIYWPLARIGAFLDRKNCLPAAWPLAYYRDKSFYTMRTDALDRFGTRLEKRFTRKQIETLLGQSGFKEIRFSDSPPFWCAVATRNRHSYTEVNGR